MQVDEQPQRRARLDDLHAPGAHRAVAAPGIDGALTRRRADISALHGGVLALPGRPLGPAAEIVEEGLRIGKRRKWDEDEEEKDDAKNRQHVPPACAARVKETIRCVKRPDEKARRLAGS